MWFSQSWSTYHSLVAQQGFVAHSLETVPAISKGQCCPLLPLSIQTFDLLCETFLLLDLISRLNLGPTIAFSFLK